MDSIKRQTVLEVVNLLCEKAPLSFAEEWDNVGLLVGDPLQETSGAVVSIDLTWEAISLAVERNDSFIITHHPCIFPKSARFSHFTVGTPLYVAIQKGISVAAFHTNFDRCALSVLEKVSQGLEVQVKGRLIEDLGSGLYEVASGLGYGFWGELSHPVSFSEFAKRVSFLFGLSTFCMTHPVPSQVFRIAFVPGKGASFIDAAHFMKCDVFITGEVGYHAALRAAGKKMTLLEVGHRESELFFGETIINWLSPLSLNLIELKTPTQIFWQEKMK